MPRTLQRLVQGAAKFDASFRYFAYTAMGSKAALSRVAWSGIVLSLVAACGPNDSGAPQSSADTGGQGSGGATSSGGTATGGEPATGGGGGSSASGGSANGTGGTGAASKTGQVILSSFDRTLGLTATFSDGSGAERLCERAESGPCYVRTCDEAPEEALGARPDAGPIMFSVPGLDGVLLIAPDESGKYGSVVSTFETAFGGGEQGTLVAEGGEVPSFKQAVEVPLALLLTKPVFTPSTSETIFRENDLTFEWLRGTPGVSFYVQATSPRLDGQPGDVRLSCSFPSEAGSGVIPSTLLRAVAVNTPFLVRTMRNIPITVEDYTIQVATVFGVYNEAKDVLIEFDIQ